MSLMFHLKSTYLSLKSTKSVYGLGKKLNNLENIVIYFLQDFCGWPEESFEEMDSTLVVQQYIQQLIRKDPSSVEFILTMPEASSDEGVWKYEHLR